MDQMSETAKVAVGCSKEQALAASSVVAEFDFLEHGFCVCLDISIYTYTPNVFVFQVK